jgi:cytochrome P450
MFPPVIHIAKGIPSQQSLTTSSTVSITHPVTEVTHTLAPGTIIYINCIAVQHDPSIYGHNVESFRPDRFIDDSNSKSEHVNSKIKSFGKGTFLAWSAGPRVCPGMKMSQVEFVSVFMTIFRRWRVELVRKDVGGRRETVEEARERAREAMRDSQSRLTLQMNRPREVKVRFVERGR